MRAYFENENKLVVESDTVAEAIALKHFAEYSRLKNIPDCTYFRNIFISYPDINGAVCKPEQAKESQ